MQLGYTYTGPVTPDPGWGGIDWPDWGSFDPGVIYGGSGGGGIALPEPATYEKFTARIRPTLISKARETNLPAFCYWFRQEVVGVLPDNTLVIAGTSPDWQGARAVIAAWLRNTQWPAAWYYANNLWELIKRSGEVNTDSSNNWGLDPRAGYGPQTATGWAGDLASSAQSWLPWAAAGILALALIQRR